MEELEGLLHHLGRKDFCQVVGRWVQFFKTSGCLMLFGEPCRSLVLAWDWGPLSRDCRPAVLTGLFRPQTLQTPERPQTSDLQTFTPQTFKPAGFASHLVCVSPAHLKFQVEECVGACKIKARAVRRFPRPSMFPRALGEDVTSRDACAFLVEPGRKERR